jgi:peptide-methionine (R)-S-oxide reductase
MGLRRTFVPRTLLVSLVLLAIYSAAPRATIAGDEAARKSSTPGPKIVPLYKSDAEWKKLLTPKQFEVTRRKGTERAYSGATWHNKRAGVYRCVCCDLELFRSENKFDSHTGWPSFWAPVEDQVVKLTPDVSELPPRTEVLCARCAAHLGHVFGDGPLPTGQRYCMNSVALKFVEDKAKSTSPSRSSTARPALRRAGP